MMQIEIGAELAEELAEYVRWLETSEGMSTVDARAATVEFALRNVFKRDRLWQAWRRKGDDEPVQSTPAPTAVRAAQPAAPSSSLPPPSGARAPTNATPAVGR